MKLEPISIMKMDQEDKILMDIHTLELRTELKLMMKMKHLKMEMEQLVAILWTHKANKFPKILWMISSSQWILIIPKWAKTLPLQARIQWWEVATIKVDNSTSLLILLIEDTKSEILEKDMVPLQNYKVQLWLETVSWSILESRTL